MAAEIDDQILQDLYAWIDDIPLSRSKKNISRDFSDGVMMAELVKYYFPELVELHNYCASSSVAQKKKNWHLLNWKVFKKLNFELSGDVIESLATCRPGSVERVLLLLRTKLDRSMYERKREQDLARARARSESRSAFQNGHASSRLVKYTEKTLGSTKDNHVSAGRNNDRYNSTIPPAKAGYQPTSVVAQTDVVPRLAYEERVQECYNKDEIIRSLQSQLRKMEHMMHLKDVKLEELSRRVERQPSDTQSPAPQVASQVNSKTLTNQQRLMQQQQQQLQQLQQQPPPSFPSPPSSQQQFPAQFPPSGPMQFGRPDGQPQFMMPPPMSMPPGAGAKGQPGNFPFPGFPPFMPLPPIHQQQADANKFRGMQGTQPMMIPQQ